MSKKLEEATTTILQELGVDLSDPSFSETPRRFVGVLRELLGSAKLDPPKLTAFPSHTSEGMVFIEQIQAATLCPHHLLPYLIVASFAYIPRNGMVVGISKPARLLQWVCGRLILQEQIGGLFIETFDKNVDSAGSMLLVRGTHLCTRIRGTKQMESVTTTYATSGQFATDPMRRHEFWSLANGTT